MYKILHYGGLGVGGRQNELIELGLTYRFDGVEIDMDDLLGRHSTMGKDFACQFLLSAKIKMGTFALPIDLGCSDEAYKDFQSKIDTILDLAQTLGCQVCCVDIAPTSIDTPFQENFEQHRLRLHEIGEKFASSNVRVGVKLRASTVADAKGDHKFIQTAEEVLTLVKTVGHANVGLCLDTFEWQVGGGAMDQISEIDVNSITEVRLGDVSDEADLSNVKGSDRLLPGESSGSIAVKLIAHLISNQYEGAVSVGTNPSMFSGAPREKVVERISQRLDCLIAQEDFHAPAAEAEAAETPGDSAEEASSEKDKTVSVTA